MNAEIFIPMYYMVLLTASVFLLSTIIRFKNVLIDKSHTGSELMKIPLPASAEQITKQADRNLINLFEFPILFYAICIVLYVSGKVDAYFVVLGYWFVGLRVAHSLYHIFINGFIVASSFTKQKSTSSTSFTWFNLNRYTSNYS